MDQYPERYIYIRGRECRCQVLTDWRDNGDPPRYIAVNSLDRDYPGEFIAERRMGAWMSVSLQDVVRDVEEFRKFLVTQDVDKAIIKRMDRGY
jgi:hypothetical protein